MKRIFVFGLVLALLASFMAPATPFGAAQVQAATAQTYQVTVGYENAKIGALAEAFFPETVTIHVGDSVHWVQNTHEIHTVSFLAGSAAPALIIPAPSNPLNSPLMFNGAVAFPARPANGLYNGSTYTNSGLMSLDPGNPTSFDLTFTQPGTYDYICLVHGVAMSGKVVVLPASRKVPSPAQTIAAGKQQMARQVAKIEDVFEQAASMVTPPSRNADGSMTYHVMMGFDKGQIDLMRFFPKNLNVRPGDTVVWSYGMSMPGMEMPPHTVTFFNGTPDQELVVPVPQVNAPPLLVINPLVLLPSTVTNPAQAGQPLTRNGYYHSGLLQSPASFSLKIGAISGVIDYECLLHDLSGMVGTLNVLSH
jgi:plastocyanin